MIKFNQLGERIPAVSVRMLQASTLYSRMRKLGVQWQTTKG